MLDIWLNLFYTLCMSKKNLDKQIALLKEQSAEVDKQAEILAKQKEEEEKQGKVEIVEEVVPYNVFGRDFSVNSPNIVEFYKHRMKMMVVQYKLVGKVDDEGRYRISKDIKYDLIAMKKEIEEMGDDYYKVSTLYMKKYFNFTIKLTMLEDGKVKASLSLAEYVGKSVDGEVIYTHIADFVDVFDADYRIKLRKVFNLVDADAKNNDFDIPNLAVLMQDLFDMDLYIGGLYDMASQIYVMRMLKILESGGKLERDVIERYKQLVAAYENEEEDEQKGASATMSKSRRAQEKEKEKNINEKYKELLDKAIDEAGGLEKLNVDKKQLNSVVGEINKTNDAIEELSVAGIGEINMEEIRTTKSGGGVGGDSAKKKAKKKGDGDKKKDPKKKDKKKDDKKDDKKKSGGGVYWSPSKDDELLDDIILGLEELEDELEEDLEEIFEEEGAPKTDEEKQNTISAILDKAENEENEEQKLDNILNDEEGEHNSVIKEDEKEGFPSVNPNSQFPPEQEQVVVVEEVIVQEENVVARQTTTAVIQEDAVIVQEEQVIIKDEAGFTEDEYEMDM